MSQKCLIIADDLTGGADAGAQFAKRGFSTLLISLKDSPSIDFTQYLEGDVLVINTDSRRLSSEKAFRLVSGLLKTYDQRHFPIVYKKIDSTLRGNIGYEIGAILKETNISLCFMVPSYPEQKRTLVGGIMMVGEKPIALTEAARDTASPVQESHVFNLLKNQSSYKIGMIDLTYVASNCERLQKAVEEEQRKGNRIIVFDAFSRQDLTNIAEVAFRMEKMPLFVGSAGLAEEVAKKVSQELKRISHPLKQIKKKFKHIFIVSGSASNVAHNQLKKLEGRRIPAFQLDKSLLTGDIQKRELSIKIAIALGMGHVILKTCSERILSEEPKDLAIPIKIIETLAYLALSALEESKLDAHDLALILTGGDTALSILKSLKAEGVEIEGELLEGIVKGCLIGGKWQGLKVITKAGAFGKENALVKIIEILETGSSSSK